MKSIIIKQGLIILSFGLLTGCNNNSKDKTANTGAKVDTAATKTDTVPKQDLVKEPTIPASNQQDYSYEPAVSVITGTITTESFYGPPGFGEHPKTDSREEVYILALEKPINVISTAKETDDDANTTKKNVSKIQLISPDNVDLADYKNKKIRLTGTFFGPQTGHHHTDVLLDIQKLEE